MSPRTPVAMRRGGSMGRRTIALIGTLLVGTVVGMGGSGSASALPQTNPYLTVRPGAGPGGTQVWVQGYVSPGFSCGTIITFDDSAGRVTFLAKVPGGQIDLITNIPSGAILGAGQLYAAPTIRPNRCRPYHPVAQAPFK